MDNLGHLGPGACFLPFRCAQFSANSTINVGGLGLRVMVKGRVTLLQ